MPSARSVLFSSAVIILLVGGSFFRESSSTGIPQRSHLTARKEDTNPFLQRIEVVRTHTGADIQRKEKGNVAVAEEPMNEFDKAAKTSSGSSTTNIVDSTDTGSTSAAAAVSPPNITVLSNGDMELDGAYLLRREKCKKHTTLPLEASVLERPWANFVFGVLTEPSTFERRLQPMLSTWLTDTWHTYLYVTDNELGLQLKEQIERDSKGSSTGSSSGRNITVVLLKPLPSPIPDNTTGSGAWKNLPALEHLGTVASQQQKGPLWFVLLDDDSYLLAKNTHWQLLKVVDDASSSALATSPQTTASNGPVTDAAFMEGTPIYAGHLVEYCSLCRTAKKRFPFVFGGNGIFMNRAFLELVGPSLASCANQVLKIAGDERIGFCVKLLRAAGKDVRAWPMTAGTETMFAALGDHRTALDEGAYPFSFHRLVQRSWVEDLRALEVSENTEPLERRAAAVWPCWHDVADWYLSKQRSQYDGRLYYPHTYDPKFRAAREYQEQLKAKLAARRGRRRG